MRIADDFYFLHLFLLSDFRTSGNRRPKAATIHLTLWYLFAGRKMLILRASQTLRSRRYRSLSARFCIEIIGTRDHKKRKNKNACRNPWYVSQRREDVDQSEL